MKVKLVNSPTHDVALNTIYVACRQCYNVGFVGDKYPFDDIPTDNKEKLISRVINSGHLSTIEHVSFTFAIGEISRAAAQQLTRHRVASFSMSSQRYCQMKDMDMHVADSIKNDPEVYKEFQEIANLAARFYTKITTRKQNPIPKEDARDILPIGWYTNIVMTMNCRELLHFFHERLCKNAQQEIRDLANQMLKLCKGVLPEVFKHGGPKCLHYGYCNEGERSCGMMPLKEIVLLKK